MRTFYDFKEEQDEEVRINTSFKQVKRIVAYYKNDNSNNLLRGIEFFDEDGKKLLGTRIFSDSTAVETLIDSNERIVGFRSRKHSDTLPAAHYDF